jgi:hypothetical protein
MYLTVHGNVDNLGVNEEWQFGIRMHFSGTLNLLDTTMNGIAQECLSDVRGWWHSVHELYGSTTTFTHVKLARIQTNGEYNGDAAIASNSPSHPAFSAATDFRKGGTSGGRVLPAQIAVVATLLTDTSRGRASKGRIYMPAPHTNGMGLNGGLDTPMATTYANATANLIKNLNNVQGIDALGVPLECSVFSRVGAGVRRKITGVAVGRRFDVQRRRAERFPETPFHSPVDIG